MTAGTRERPSRPSPEPGGSASESPRLAQTLSPGWAQGERDTPPRRILMAAGGTLSACLPAAPRGVSRPPRSEHGPLGRLLLPPAATREQLMLESRWSPPVLVPSTSPGHTLPSPPARTCAPEARGPRVCSVPASLTFGFSTRVSGLSVGRKGFSDAQEMQCDSHLKKGGLVAWKPLSIVTLVHRSSVY